MSKFVSLTVAILALMISDLICFMSWADAWSWVVCARAFCMATPHVHAAVWPHLQESRFHHSWLHEREIVADPCSPLRKNLNWRIGRLRYENNSHKNTCGHFGTCPKSRLTHRDNTTPNYCIRYVWQFLCLIVPPHGMINFAFLVAFLLLYCSGSPADQTWRKGSQKSGSNKGQYYGPESDHAVEGGPAPPMDRPRCQCCCGCRSTPGAGGRRMCTNCNCLVGPGCCWCGDDVGLCHMCAGGNPQEVVVPTGVSSVECGNNRS